MLFTLFFDNLWSVTALLHILDDNIIRAYKLIFFKFNDHKWCTRTGTKTSIWITSPPPPSTNGNSPSPAPTTPINQPHTPSSAPPLRNKSTIAKNAPSCLPARVSTLSNWTEISLKISCWDLGRCSKVRDRQMLTGLLGNWITKFKW